MLTDTHSHLFWESFEPDFDQVISRAAQSGVDTVLNVGVDVELSEKALRQIPAIEKTGQIKAYSSVAIHPEEAIRYHRNEDRIEKDIGKLENIYLSDPAKVIAVGECGLDYGYFGREGYLPEGLDMETAKNLQRKLFQFQINLAKKYQLPLILHVRDDRSKNPDLIECWDEIFEMAGDHFGILHCYSGLEQTTLKALNSNFLVSFAGNLTYPKNEYLREAVRLLPLEKIVLETDCPFLPPQSLRGKRNEPSSVKEIAEVIASLKGIPVEEIAHRTSLNFKRLFNLQS